MGLYITTVPIFLAVEWLADSMQVVQKFKPVSEGEVTCISYGRRFFTYQQSSFSSRSII